MPLVPVTLRYLPRGAQMFAEDVPTSSRTIAAERGTVFVGDVVEVRICFEHYEGRHRRACWSVHVADADGYDHQEIAAYDSYRLALSAAKRLWRHDVRHYSGKLSPRDRKYL
jgi:hypothetical protein